MSDLEKAQTLLTRAKELAIWTGNDEVYGPGCRTVDRMNEIRQLLIEIVALLVRITRDA